MNNELTETITSFIVKTNIDCFRIPTTNADDMMKELATSFNWNLSNRYLWEGAIAKEYVVYDDNGHWETLLSGLLQNFGKRVYLTLTNDEFFPWSVFDCNKNAVIDMLKEHPYFEYFIFDKSMQHILFDTHHNELLLVSR